MKNRKQIIVFWARNSSRYYLIVKYVSIKTTDIYGFELMFKRFFIHDSSQSVYYKCVQNIRLNTSHLA